VDGYFNTNKISKYGNSALVLKTIVLCGVYVLPFAALLYFQPGLLVSLALWTLMGLGIAGLGMSVMHDGNHGAYSSSKRVNWLMAHVLNLMGGSTYNWKLQHNILHHTYTNITDLDDDIASKPALRLSPHAKPSSLHRSQWIHGFLLYGLTTLFWVTAKDFIQYFRYKKNKVSAASEKESRWIFTKTIILKLVYFAVFVFTPIFIFKLPVLQVITGFLLMHFVAGLVLTVIFQLAHSVEGTSHPMPNKDGILENDWAIHQMNTTMNFSPNNKLLSWYVGGLNYQVEHHLFPRISHVHYPALSSIVRKTAEEYNIPYLEHRTFAQALKAHVRFLKELGRLPNLEEAVG
jgi:linoleoyl-CoA desaturase